MWRSGNSPVTNTAALQEVLRPLSWLLGRWRSEAGGLGYYPTIKTFSYGEELHFFHVGQPSLEIRFYAWYAETQEPLHREIGFIRIQPDTNKIALLSAHNIGYSELQEGEVVNTELRLETVGLHRMTFGKDPAATKLRRVIRQLNENQLEQVVFMATVNTPMTEHLRIIYNKVSE